eukprot:1156393-Pelagomonas_calceolata.AAC.3
MRQSVILCKLALSTGLSRRSSTCQRLLRLGLHELLLLLRIVRVPRPLPLAALPPLPLSMYCTPLCVCTILCMCTLTQGLHGALPLPPSTLGMQCGAQWGV